ncbi:amino acid ABC transporter permease [Leuconostoc mesenteroides]|uniref:amino acid ABC transporter permease n=1 Tax=Leuconostoc mesenteroides TaxID=1245 RepID=UPI00107F6D92|nr:amino acid ABC transporter permease [Leuconostoc mesenteroides]TGD34388.1 amino acid ABC transporter permease [Leuconostoc mesenteroides]
MSFSYEMILDYAPFFMHGLLYTLLFSLCGVVFGTIFGLIIALGRMSKNPVISGIFKTYIGLFRGTPLFVQILITNFGVVPAIFGQSNPYIAGALSLSLNAAAYIAETFRSGIQSISEGQREAARTLDLSQFDTMRFIIVPQAIKIVIPALGNEFISLIKDSSLVSAISAPEITYWAQAMNAQYYVVWTPYLTVAVLYLILTLSASRLMKLWERKMAQND